MHQMNPAGKTRPFYADKCEILFYQQLARETDLRTPQCYYSAMNIPNGKYVRILEDLAPATVGDQIRGSTAKEIALALRAIAGFHAHWWQNEKLAGFDWLAGSATDSVSVTRWILEEYRKAFPVFVDKTKDLLTDAVKAFGEQLSKKLTDNPQREKPLRTLIHGDFVWKTHFLAPLWRTGFRCD